jgi:hypothetical protein
MSYFPELKPRNKPGSMVVASSTPSLVIEVEKSIAKQLNIIIPSLAESPLKGKRIRAATGIIRKVHFN